MTRRFTDEDEDECFHFLPQTEYLLVHLVNAPLPQISRLMAITLAPSRGTKWYYRTRLLGLAA